MQSHTAKCLVADTICWREVPPDVGQWLWGLLRLRLGHELHVHETFTDPHGVLTGSPFVLTVIGPRNGPSILRCESRGDEHHYYVPALFEVTSG